MVINSRRPHYRTATVEGIPPFAEKIEFQFDDSVNVLIGANGTGKSTILKLLSLDVPKTYVRGYKSEGLNVTIGGLWPRNQDGSSTDVRAVPQLYLPPVRVGMMVGSEWRRVLQTPLRDDRWETILNSPLSSHYFQGGHLLYHAVQKLFNEEMFALRGRRRAVTAAHHAYECVKYICSEILTGEHFQNIRTVVDLSDNKEIGELPSSLLAQHIEHYFMGVNTLEADDEDIYIGELSTGTQGVLIWVFYWAIKLARAYEFAPLWEEMPGIIFIDEVENHLHPTWQRRVIPALLKYFPGLQIFATTHSPFVVAGLKAGQVHLLKRSANGVITASSNTEDVIGWTADEILRVFMGVDDPTDDATAAAARELRQLRDAGLHPDERQEEQRQARMRELRQQVDGSLLAGGPRAAEDERFAANLAGILERYRQSRDLNQENG